MSLWSDFWDFVDDTVDDVGDVISDAWDSIKSNPIGTITSVVAMAYGIPPAWAGALGGAAGAAATGGNVVKAAITGGAMGYMGSAAGAYAGSAGPIAQAAAAGTAASVTGAILTGQDVLTAAKQGLILGAVTGGVVKLMSPAEAISAVKPQSLAELTANSSDPLGDLIKLEGWTDSNSARAAASQAFSKNAATTQTMLMESVPDYVLQAAAQTNNPAAYITNELGWNQNSLTVGAANNAANNYKQEVAAQEAAAKTEAAKPINQLEAAGIDKQTAQVMVDSGINNQVDVNIVKDLLAKGYTATDIVDLQGAGVDLNGLRSLSTNVFNANQIDNMLTKGVSVNDISAVSTNASRYGVGTDTLQSLLEHGATNNQINSLNFSGQLNSAATLLDNGVSINDINNLRSNGWDINKLASQVDKGFITGDEITNTIKTNYNRTGMNSLLNDTTPVVSPEELAQQQQAQQQAQQQLADQQLQAKIQNAKTNGWLTEQQIIDQHMSPEDVAWYNDYMDKLYGNKTPVQPEVTSPEVAQPVQPEVPGQTVDVSNITQEELNQITQQNNPYTNTTDISQTASYTAEQEALYNQLRGQGYTAQQATEMITNGSISDAGSGMSVDVSGSPVYSDVIGSGLKGEIPQGYELAPSTDLTGATYNADINAYIRPVSTPPSTPIVPIVVPPTTTTTTTPPTTQPSTPVAPVTVTPPTTVPPTGTGTGGTSNVGGTTAPQPVGGPTTETDSQGNMWYVQPMSDGSVQRDLAWQKPGTTVSSEHVTTPAQPVQPAAPTVVSTSTRTTYDGSVYRDTQMSDGTVTSTLVSGPTGTGSGTGTGTTTPPPLTPPTQEVIPPGSSYVAPVETGTTPPTTDTTTTPPTNNGTDYVPMIPPTGQPTTPAEDTYRGRYTLGEPVHPAIPHTLNPGWITNVPDFYQTTNPAQSHYYWGGHPYQTGTTFDRTLYNQVPNAPATPWGATHAQTAATPQQIINAMGGYYPLIGSQQ